MSGEQVREGRLRKAFGQPGTRFAWHDDEDNGHDPAVGWDLAFGCQVSFGYEDDVLKAVVSMSDGSGNGHEVREVWPTQVREFGQRLVALMDRNAPRERTLARVIEESMADIVPRPGSSIPEVISAVMAVVVAHEDSRAEHGATTVQAATDAVTAVVADRARVREQRDKALDLADALLGLFPAVEHEGTAMVTTTPVRDSWVEQYRRAARALRGDVRVTASEASDV